jgi:hypothetical protein
MVPPFESLAGAAAGRSSASQGSSFALAVEPVELVETRRELVREVQHWLGIWENSRSEEVRGRLVQSLEVLALLVKAGAA